MWDVWVAFVLMFMLARCDITEARAWDVHLQVHVQRTDKSNSECGVEIGEGEVM